MNTSLPPIPEDYSPESFGQPLPVYDEQQSGKGRTFACLGCGGMSAVLLLCCCCCVGIFALVIRQPMFVVQFWGTGGTTESWDLSEMFVCEDSQAAELTQEYANNGARFVTFNVTYDENLGSSTVEGVGILNEQGQTINWEATFYTETDNSIPGHCIERIEIKE